MRKPEWFTCLMPVYNGEKYLKKAIESILRQTYPKFEFLIIDDGSTDSSASIINSYTDPRIRYVYKENGGISSALNLGLKLATHDWVFRMDADDISLPARFEEQIKTCSFKENEINGCDYAAFRNDRIQHFVKIPRNKEQLFNSLYKYLVILHASLLYNKKFIISSGGYNDSVKNIEDYELFCRLFEKIHYSVTPLTLFLYRYLRYSNAKNYELITMQRMKYIEPLLMGLLDNDDSISARVKDELSGWFYLYSLELKTARKFLSSNLIHSFSLKKITACIMTYLPEKIVMKFFLNPPKNYFSILKKSSVKKNYSLN